MKRVVHDGEVQWTINMYGIIPYMWYIECGGCDNDESSKDQRRTHRIEGKTPG